MAKLTADKLTAFLAVLAETCNVQKACSAIGISRFTAYEWRKNEPGFNEAWEYALTVGRTRLVDEAVRRATDGVDKPLVNKGQLTYKHETRKDDQGNVLLDAEGNPRLFLVLDENGQPIVETVKEYSDTLLARLLQAYDPAFRDRQEITHRGDQALLDALLAARARTGAE